MDEEQRSEAMQDLMTGTLAHNLALRAIVTALLAKDVRTRSPLREEDVMALVEPLLPVDRQGQRHFRTEVGTVVADMMTAASLLSTGRTRPRTSRK